MRNNFKSKSTLLVDLTYSCNLRCKHCYNSNLLSTKCTDMKVSKLDEIIYKYNIGHVHFIGGEPLMHKKFKEIIESLSKNYIISVNTNGLLIDDVGVEFLVTHIDEMTISLDGLSPYTNDMIRGKNTFNIVYSNIKKILAAKERLKSNILINIASVITPDNVNEFLDIERFRIKGIDNYLFMTLYYEGNAKNYDANDKFYYDYSQLIEKLSKLDGNYIVDTTPLAEYIFGYKETGCMCNGNKIKYSDSSGNIYKCNAEKQYEIKNNNFKEKFFIDDNHKVCKFCRFKIRCNSCEYGLYFSRHNYCEYILKYLYNLYNFITLDNDIKYILYKNKIILFNFKTRVRVEFYTDEFFENVVIENNALFLKDVNNYRFNAKYFKKIITLGGNYD